MSDLISRKAIIKAIEELPNCYNGWSDAYDKAYIITTIEDLPAIDLVRCGECKHKIQALSTEQGATGCELIRGTFYEDFFCKCGEKRADYTVFTVNPPKGIETPLRGDATVSHKNSKMDEKVARPTATSSTEVPWWIGE